MLLPRDTAAHIALLSLSCLPGLASAAATNYTLPNECRAFPGSRDWPSTGVWKSLNETLGGRLLAPAPPGAVCHLGHPTYDADQCPNVQRNWSSYQWHTENPVSVMRDQFTKYSCLPDPKVPCSGQGYPPYVVDAFTAEHVKIGVDFARKHNIRLVVRGTGHDFIGRSIAPGALSIWTHHMSDITFRPGKFKLAGSSRVLRGNAVTVGAGAQMFDVYKATDKYGQTIVGGAGKSVGITGYMTGAGHSVLAPRFGLAADNVLEIEVVTPAGKLITANEDRHPDLFWAMRGGGGSTFGVITNITMWTHPSPKITSIRWMAVTDAKSPFLYDLAANVLSKFPQLVRSGISGWNFVTNHIADPIPEPGRNATGPLAGAFGITLIQNSNDSNVAQKVFKPVQDVIQAEWRGKARLLLQTKQYPSFLAWITENYDMSPAGNSSWAVSRLLDERALTGDTKALANALKAGSKPSGSVMAFLVSSKGAKNARPRGGGNAVNPAWHSAFVHALTVANYSPFNKTAEQDTINLLDTSFQPLRDLTPQSGAYVNEALPFEKDWQHSFWGSNYERLVKIKREVDPTDVLWFLGANQLYGCGNFESLESVRKPRPLTSISSSVL
ncbi:FAD binding domain-containing protein [Hirsutella rhossiliensis]|uniref:FAD binding domain-containing protein n=1 Tax=Hirsutella rhossiliensis TaxID=111463 RepID=A0A9P8MTS5_9HYPO|nr:FAD binding domain-containing protein [Hirsutella rhossiliensis]KAH0959067.1 FAD binding domain-containing protein [Hirsutella rhossiliensis]